MAGQQAGKKLPRPRQNLDQPSAPTLPTALAAPVEEGMMFAAAARPPRQSCDTEKSLPCWGSLHRWQQEHPSRCGRCGALQQARR